MNKTWLGYLASVLFLFAGIFELMAGKIVVGVLFVVLSIGNTYISYRLSKLKK